LEGLEHYFDLKTFNPNKKRKKEGTTERKKEKEIEK